MKERLGNAYPAFFASYDLPPQKGLRVNTLKLSCEQFEQIAPFALGEKVCWDESGYYVGEEKAGADVYHFAGLYYMQEPSAMCAASMLLKYLPEEARVLDLCAAPGGKTTRLAAGMGGRGVLCANEIDFGRARILSQNVERMGITNCAVMSTDSAKIALRFENYFDGVLVDAPCSGEGMFKKEAEAVSHWSEANVAMCASRQKDILDNAAKTVAGGGYLLYSTCTFSEEEDEWQAADFLRRHKEFTLIEQTKLYPHTARGEGHFAACFKKEEGERAEKRRYGTKKNEAERAYTVFAKAFFRKQPSGTIVTLEDGRCYLVPSDMADMGALSLHLLRLGIELGEFDGKVFKPAHALAMAVKREDVNVFVSLSREQARAYLHGETLTCELENGWCVVGVEDYPLGLGKIVNGVVKNHLPRGLRMIK